MSELAYHVADVVDVHGLGPKIIGMPDTGEAGGLKACGEICLRRNQHREI